MDAGKAATAFLRQFADNNCADKHIQQQINRLWWSYPDAIV